MKNFTHHGMMHLLLLSSHSDRISLLSIQIPQVAFPTEGWVGGGAAEAAGECSAAPQRPEIARGGALGRPAISRQFFASTTKHVFCLSITFLHVLELIL